MNVKKDEYFKSEKEGSYTEADAEELKEDYFNDILKRIELKKKFKIVIDSGMGTTGMYAPELFKRAGCWKLGC